MIEKIEDVVLPIRMNSSEIKKAEENNRMVGLAYGDDHLASPSFKWSGTHPLRMIAHDQIGEIY